MLRAGLETAPFVSADDTGARHAGKNGFCIQIGNDWFTCGSARGHQRVRLNFLDLLRAGHTDYVLNDAAYGYMRRHGLSAPAIALLMAGPRTRFDDPAAWLAHLDRLGFNALKVTPDPIRIASEGASWGGVQSHQVPLRRCRARVTTQGSSMSSRHAFVLGPCRNWLVHKLNTFTDRHRAAHTAGSWS